MTASEARAHVAQTLAIGDTTAEVAAALLVAVADCGDAMLLRLLRVLRRAEMLADETWTGEVRVPSADEVRADDAWCAVREYVEAVS